MGCDLVGLWVEFETGPEGKASTYGLRKSRGWLHKSLSQRNCNRVSRSWGHFLPAFLALGRRRSSLAVCVGVIQGHGGWGAPRGVQVTRDPGTAQGVFPFIELIRLTSVEVVFGECFRVAVGGGG